MNEQEAYARLGLQDPVWFAKCAALYVFEPENHTGDPKRQGGRTTQMLIRAALKLQEPVQVKLVGKDFKHQFQMEEKCLDLVYRLGLTCRGALHHRTEAERIVYLGHSRHIFGCIEFRDHAAPALRRK